MSGLDIALHYLDKLDTELERRIEALEESNERKLDVIHFVKRALEETRSESVAYQARLKEYNESMAKKPLSRKAENKGAGAGAKATTPLPPPAAGGDEKQQQDEKVEKKSKSKSEAKRAGGDDEGGVRSSLDDILAKARDLRQSKANQVPQPPFGSRQGARASSLHGSKQPLQQRGKAQSSSSSAAPKKAASKPAATSRRPLHESKFVSKRGGGSSTDSGAKATTPSSRGSSERLSTQKPGATGAERKMGGTAASPVTQGASSPSPMHRAASPIMSPSRRSEEKGGFSEEECLSPPKFHFGPYSTHLLMQVRPPLSQTERTMYYDGADINEKAVLVEESMPRPADFVAKATELSEAMGRLALPPSVLLGAFRDLPALRKREEARMRRGGEGYGDRSDEEEEDGKYTKGNEEDYGGEEEDEEEEQEEQGEEEDWQEDLSVALEERGRALDVLKQCAEEYERKWSLKLGRMRERGGEGSGDRSAGLALLPEREREDLFTLWYRMRRCFEMYGDVQDRVDRLLLCMARDMKLETPSGVIPKEPVAVSVLRERRRRYEEQNPPRSWEQRLFEDLVEDLPDRTPFHLYRAAAAAAAAAADADNAGAAGSTADASSVRRLRKLSSRDQAVLQEKLRHVNAFHDDVKARVNYVAEAIIGRHVLKELVREMKHCYERQVPRSQWVEPLKKYQMLHTMLVENCQVGNTIKFFDKKTTT